jgi:hydroxymethylglutaryl-CoA lyase
MADTADVLAGLDLTGTRTKLLAIVANSRGAAEACSHAGIDYLGYPFSISETFQQRNTRKSIAESMDLVQDMQAMCLAAGKELVVYISMAFGNPYGDEWHPGIAEKWVGEMAAAGVRTIALADTVGSADPASIGSLFGALIPRFPEVVLGAHFHAHPLARHAKLQAAWDQGCRRFDAALNGFGGCPFAEDELVGNISTQSLLAFLMQQGASPAIDAEALAAAEEIALTVFG